MNTYHILALIILTTLIACGQTSSQKKESVISTDSLIITLKQNEAEYLVQSKEDEEWDSSDSLKLDKILQDALKTADTNIRKNKYFEEYIVPIDSITVSIAISFGYHFTKANPHLIIRRKEPNFFYIDIYSKNNNKFEKVISHKQWTLTYVSDTIRDINGDGLNDFVVNWYGSTGCCLKAFSNIYLIKQNKKAFSENFEFINPTFSPKEKIIRGVCYGHPGKTEMYKYKWNGEKIDTIEYISYETNLKGAKTGKIIVTHQSHDDKFKTLKVLNFIPAEYKKIEGYDWFTGNGYN